MMRTEDEARVSLEDTFTSEADSPENSGKGSARAGSPSKQKAEKKRSGGQRGCCYCLRQTFGPFSPFCGNETWEEAGTSWILPDPVYILWRVAAFCAMLGIHISLLRSNKTAIGDFSTDVYTMTLVTTALLLLPPAAFLINGPHEDDLDAHGVRWLWSVIAAMLQITTTTTIYVTSTYFALVGRSARLIHIVPAILLQIEMVVGCVIPRLSYSVVGSIIMAAQLALTLVGLARGIGPWLTSAISRGEWECMFAIFIHVLTGLCIVALGRGRHRFANWVERRRDEQDTKAAINW